MPSSVIICRVPTIQPEEPSKIPPNTAETKRGRLRDYTKHRGESFDAMDPSTKPRTSLKNSTASLSPSPGSDRRSRARSDAYNSLQSAMSGADSLGSTSTKTNDGWTDQVNFVLKIPSIKRQKDSFGSEGSGRRTPVQELRESLHRCKPSHIRKSMLALRKELHQTNPPCHNSRLLFDESDRRHSENEVSGRRSRRNPKKSIIQREVEASISHSSDSCESLDDMGPQRFGSTDPPRRATSLEELFADLQLGTARRADFMKAPTPLRTIGSNNGNMKGDVRVYDFLRKRGKDNL